MYNKNHVFDMYGKTNKNDRQVQSDVQITHRAHYFF